MPFLRRRDWMMGAVTALLAVPAHGADRLDRFRAGRNGVGRLDHGDFDRLLGRHVHPSPDGVNRVAYAGWKASAADRAALSTYIAGLERNDPATLSRPEQFAFWVNLYNAATVRLVLDRYPVRSIRDIKPNLLSIGPWKMPVVAVDGLRLSLDDIEHGILRRGWREPRIHYAVNCASIGCPNLRTRAFRGATLEADLADAARDFVNHPRGARVEAGRLVASNIYNWYRVDFGGSESGVVAHLRRHALGPLKAQLTGITTVAKYAYDWSLNGSA